MIYFPLFTLSDFIEVLLICYDIMQSSLFAQEFVVMWILAVGTSSFLCLSLIFSHISKVAIHGQVEQDFHVEILCSSSHNLIYFSFFKGLNNSDQIMYEFYI